MEGGPVRAALRRARGLARRSWSTVLVITMLQFALPILVWKASVDLSVTWELDDRLRLRGWGYGLSSSGKAALFQLLNVFVTPLTSIMSALLYLKMRQAGGESLVDAAERFDSIRVPQSRWQARLRARSASTGPSGTSG
jgi:hypothetical protein